MNVLNPCQYSFPFSEIGKSSLIDVGRAIFPAKERFLKFELREYKEWNLICIKNGVLRVITPMDGQIHRIGFKTSG